MQPTQTQVTPLVSPPVTLSVTQYGDRDSATHVLLVHGFPDDWHTITYDVRGSGRSTRPESRSAYRTEMLVEDLIAVLDATVPAGEKVHLVGHDWGSTALWDAVAAETWDSRLEDDVDVSRGDMIARVKNAPKPSPARTSTR